MSSRRPTPSPICRDWWYDDEALVDALAAYNNLPDPDRLANGMRLVIPERTLLVALRPMTESSLPATTVAVAPEAAAELLSMARTPQPGDTLSEIAQKPAGTSRATARLFEFNRSVLPDMDALQVGTTAPPTATELRPPFPCLRNCSSFSSRPSASPWPCCPSARPASTPSTT